MTLTNDILNEREQTHGSFREVAGYAQAIKTLMRSSRNWDRLDVVQAQSLEVIADKMARILCGDPSHLDHWDDGAGYFELTARDLRAAQAAHRAQVTATTVDDEPLNAPAFLTEERK